MKKILKSPAVNAVCISLFTAFYTTVMFANLTYVLLCRR